MVGNLDGCGDTVGGSDVVGGRLVALVGAIVLGEMETEGFGDVVGKGETVSMPFIVAMTLSWHSSTAKTNNKELSRELRKAMVGSQNEDCNDLLSVTRASRDCHSQRSHNEPYDATAV